ncbi:MAG TPA: hypothetical protein VFS23_31355 [Vicinamibacterales bacterium]|nr:hypothetical protein [Vicinamibacterales bacterium]
MKSRIAAVLLSGAVLSGASNYPMFTAPLRLTATITPNPLRAPARPGAGILWDLELKAEGSGSVLLERGYARLVDAAGRVVGSTLENLSRSAGCTTCDTDLRIEDGASMTFNDKQIVYVGGAPPARLIYTVSFSDRLGKGSTTVEVPLHLFAQASGSTGTRERRSALTMKRLGAGPT